jgi:GcrA cell cycle regulator
MAGLPNYGGPWSEEEDDCLRMMAAAGETIANVAKAVKRTHNGVQARGRALGVSFRRWGGVPWTKDDDDTLRQFALANKSRRDAARRLGRSFGAVVHRVLRLNLKFHDWRVPFEWTAERVNLAKELWHEGKSGSAIARMLGPPFTRSSVVAKLHRLGCRRSRLAQSERKLPRKQLKRRKRGKPGRFTIELARSRDWKTPPKPPMVLPLTRTDDVARVSHEGLGPNHCRWVVGDIPEAIAFHKPLYCGRPHLPFLPYCTEHATRAYRFISREPHQTYWTPYELAKAEKAVRK